MRGDWETIICDGAVRSGKTFSMGLSFFLWAQSAFDGRQFGLCGKTIASIRRNLLGELIPFLRRLGMTVREKRSENLLTVRFGGRENLEAIDFLRQLNAAAFQTEPAVMMIAEESTAFPLITKPDYDGGLGFLFKWNMGWMNDMLQYMSLDPLYRKGDHNALTFSMTYAFSENFILPLSHDEVVHGKCSLIGKMPGNYDDKFNNLRVLYAYQMAHPGKKLNFMGSEFAQFIEWNFKQGLDWLLLGYEKHQKMQQFVKTLNRFYLENRELWEVDTGWDGYEWIEPDDRDRSVIAFRRKDRKGRELVVVCNFCPVLRENYRLGLPKQGWYVPVLNTDDEAFGGYGFAPETVRTEKKPSHGQMQSGLFRVPPMSVCFYRYQRAKPQP